MCFTRKRKKRRGGAAAAATQLDKKDMKKTTSQNKAVTDPNPKDKLPSGSKPLEVKKSQEPGDVLKTGENKQESTLDVGEAASDDR